MNLCIKYLLVVAIVLLQLSTSIYTRIDSKRLQYLDDIFILGNSNNAITARGKKDILNSCPYLLQTTLNNSRFKPIKEEKLLNWLEFLIANFPIHFLGTRGNENTFEIDALFNGTRPVIITFSLIKENGHYKLDAIKNLCDLYDLVNLSFENEFKSGDGKR